MVAKSRRFHTHMF